MKTETQRDYEERILRVLVFIQQHLDEALDLEELAALANFSPFHFHRVFRGMVGEPLKEHIRRLRLERAAYQLKTSDEPITRVAFDAGYETHEAFARAFRNRFGESPTGFRNARRKLETIASSCGVHFSPTGEVSTFTPMTSEGRNMEARIEELQPMKVAFVRHLGPYDQVGPTWEQLCGWAGMKGLFGPNTKMFGLCHDDPEVTPSDKVRYDACITIGDGIEAEGQVGVQEVAGGKYAISQHKGSYKELTRTYSALMGQWMPAQGLEPDQTKPCMEFYLNDPNQTPEDEWLTDVCVPLK